MASTGKCEFCGSTVKSDERNCPSCGAANPNFVEDAPRTVFFPKTIEELKEYCAERGMPLLRMRFFIGENYQEPRAFGIYRDGDRVVVYKNKANGSRAVRYSGPDEAYAVKELYLKLLDECHKRGIYPDGQPDSGTVKPRKKRRNTLAGVAAGVMLGLFLADALFNAVSHRKDGYYRADERLYYRYGASWYYETSYDDWIQTSSFPGEDYEDYYLGSDFDSDWGGSNFKNSDAWEAIQESHSSSSSDYDSWDSSDTDWDSDW